MIARRELRTHGFDERPLLGRDEFVVVVGHLAEPFYVTESVGVAHGAAESADTLLRRADVALYEAKARGEGGYVVAGA